MADLWFSKPDGTIDLGTIALQPLTGGERWLHKEWIPERAIGFTGYSERFYRFNR
jgi:hypothetical protein